MMLHNAASGGEGVGAMVAWAILFAYRNIM